MTEWEEIGIKDYWQPKPGETIEGKITSVDEGTYGKQYTIKTDDGEEKTTPSHKVLQNRLDTLQKGDKIKIVYEGEEPPTVKGNNPTRIYKVFKSK